MAKLDNSNEHDTLVEWLRQQVKECLESEYINEGTSEEDFYRGKRSAYQEVLEKIT